MAYHMMMPLLYIIIDDRDDYTLALTQKLNELGIKEETK